MKPPKRLREDGRVQGHFAFWPDVYRLLREISDIEHRSMTEELSHLVVERARHLGLDTGHLGKERGDR